MVNPERILFVCFSEVHKISCRLAFNGLFEEVMYVHPGEALLGNQFDRIIIADKSMMYERYGKDNVDTWINENVKTKLSVGNENKLFHI